MLHFAKKKFKVTTKMLVLAEIRSMRCKRLTFGRWDENAGKQLTFGRWAW